MTAVLLVLAFLALVDVGLYLAARRSPILDRSAYESRNASASSSVSTIASSE